jgi:hypothetical protein
MATDTYHTLQFTDGRMVASHADLIDQRTRSEDRHLNPPPTLEMRKAWAESRKQAAERSKNNDAVS